jgi:short-subunit dehydrogenase
MRRQPRFTPGHLLAAGLGAWLLARAARRLRLHAREGYFDSRVVAITGASRGLGRALARECVRRGAHVVLAARTTDQLAVVAQECRQINPSAGVLVIPTDVTDEAQRQRLIAAAQDWMGGLDVLINNAGIALNGPFVEQPPDTTARHFEVNLLAAIRLAHLALPGMVAQRGGTIVNMASVLGQMGMPYAAAYSVTKFGLAGFGEAVRRELAGTGVRVLTVFAGFADTDILSAENRTLLHQFGVRLLSPEKVAARTLDAVALGQPELVLGGTEFAAVWAGRIAPRLTDFLWKVLTPPTYRELSARQQAERERERMTDDPHGT